MDVSQPIAAAPRSRVLALGLLLLAVLAHPAGAQAPCEAAAHGMRTDGSDNVAALTKTLEECAGHKIHIAAGVYTFSPNGLANGITIPNETTLTGDGSRGPQATVFRIADSGNLRSFLWVRNVSNVGIGGIRFEGTSYDSGCNRRLDYGHAIYVQSDSGQQASVESVHIAENVFHNFNGQSWVTINAAEGSPGIGLHSSITINNNVFDSDANLQGGCAATGGIGYPVVMVWLHGSDKSAHGLLANVSVASNTFNAAYVKGAVAIWSGTNRISVQNNQIRDAGLRLPPAPNTELGRYAILVYNSAHELPGLHPETVSIVGNDITNPVSCGIYVAGGMDLDISRNRISGQSDRHDVTLPKGAIALNHAAKVHTLNDNELTNNAIGISSVGSEISEQQLGNNRISGGTRMRIVRGEPGWSQNPKD
jgi:hypothetical protein